MEEEILQEMIQDRETQIKLIQTKMELQAKRMDRIKEALATTRENYSKERIDHTLDLEQSHQHYVKIVKQFKEALQSLDMTKQQQGPQLFMYNEAMKAMAAPENRDSSYVIRMQAQLCKGMHNMGMLETQLAMVMAHSADRQKHLKDTITLVVEEKSRVELQLMNELIAADNARREVETKHKNMVESFTKEKDALIEKLEKQQEEAEKDEEEEKEKEEDDDEEKAELQEILSQGREEIARLEAENKLELARLEELKAKVAAVRGENFVEELVLSISEEFKDRDVGDGDDEDDEEGEDEEDD